MKLKGSYFYTLRENAKDEDSISGNLLVRAGFMKKVSAGIYMYLPNGLRVLNNIKNIVKEEMDKSGAQELLMPSLIPSDIYEVCGRVEAFGNDMFSLKDRFNRDMVLGPTHEELFTIAAKNMIKSYKDLPFNIYQQADKFRDEPRPRYGLIRVREFIMKDAYSFDRDEEGLEVSYQKMKEAYKNIYDRLHINYKIVKAGVGAMGGSLSEEFQAITNIGEDVIVYDDKGYSSNLEVSTYKIIEDKTPKEKLEKVETPHASSIEEVTKYLNLPIKKTMKAMLMNVDQKLVVFFLRGDRELNLDRCKKLLDAKEIGFADDNLISSSNAYPGYTGPVNLSGCIKVVDEELLHINNLVSGANEEGYHYINTNIEDYQYDLVGVISDPVEGDLSINDEVLKFAKGIEIGNLFKLGTHYAEEFNLEYLDEENNTHPVVMGCYGLGIGRILAAIIEQNNDDNGMILPINIAPYKVGIVIVNTNDEESVKYANYLEEELEKVGIDVLVDNRDERCGVKFKDIDLIGIPIRVTIGRDLVNGEVELKLRNSSEVNKINTNNILFEIMKIVGKEM